MRPDEALRRFRDRVAGPEEIAEKASRPSDLERVWVRVVPGYVRPMTREQLGQMRHLIAACGSAPAAARAILRVVPRWARFVDLVREQEGETGGPSRPHVGFLLRHAEVAMNMATDETPTRGPKVERTPGRPG